MWPELLKTLISLRAEIVISFSIEIKSVQCFVFRDRAGCFAAIVRFLSIVSRESLLHIFKFTSGGSDFSLQAVIFIFQWPYSGIRHIKKRKLLKLRLIRERSKARPHTFTCLTCKRYEIMFLKCKRHASLSGPRFTQETEFNIVGYSTDLDHVRFLYR